MPNWKKLITSGSDASLNSLTVDASIQAASLTGSLSYNDLTNVPTLVSSSGQITLSSTNGFSSFSSSIDTHLDANILALSASVDTHLDANILALSASVDTHLDANISNLSSSAHNQRVDLLSSLSSSVDTHLDANIAAVNSNITSISSSVDSRILTEKGRIDAILLSADADKDSFAEIVSLINSVDTTNDNAFASFYTASTGRLSSLESYTSSLQSTTLVSGSSQVSYPDISNIPSGIVSGSSQLNNTTIDGLTILNPTISGSQITLELPNSTTSAVVISSGLASDFDMRLGTTATNQYAWSTNLSYNGSNWVKDDATRSAWRMNQVVLTTDAASGMEFNYAPPNNTSLETLMTLRRTILDVNVPLDVSGNIVSSGNITVGGTVDGIDLQAFSASISTSLSNLTADYTQLTNIPSGIVSGSSQITLSSTNGFSSFSSSVDTHLDANIAALSSSAHTQRVALVQPINTSISNLNTFSSSLQITQYNFTGSFSGDGSGLTGVNVNLTETTTVLDTFTNQTSVSVSHNFGTKNVIVSVYDSNDAQILPDSVVTTDTNTVTVGFCESTSGRVIVAKGGHLVSGSIELFTHREAISGSNSYTVTHNLNEDYPIVQVYDSNKQQVLPQTITSTNSNTIAVTFCENLTGTIVVKK